MLKNEKSQIQEAGDSEGVKILGRGSSISKVTGFGDPLLLFFVTVFIC